MTASSLWSVINAQAIPPLPCSMSLSGLSADYTAASLAAIVAPNRARARSSALFRSAAGASKGILVS
jgi:hypothetical protein